MGLLTLSKAEVNTNLAIAIPRETQAPNLNWAGKVKRKMMNVE